MRYIQLFAAFILLTASAHGQAAYDIQWPQRDPTNTFSFLRFLNWPQASGNYVDGIPWMNSGTMLPQISKLGANLVYNSGTDTMNVGGLTTANIGDMTATGISMAQATSTAAAKTALGLAPIASSGSAADLSAGTVPDARFPATLPAISGANLTGLTKTQVGLANADNTSDANKPVSTATQTALNGKEPTITAGTTAQYWRGDKTWQTLPVPAALSFTNNASRSTVTTTSSTGFQLSSTRNVSVSYYGSLTTTSTIGGPATANAYLEICPTNSTTPGDWQTIAPAPSSQTVTLAVIIQSVQVVPAALHGIIPAGYYARIRTSGTGTFSVSSTFTGQECQL